jgi:hypothetical protein
MITPLGKACKWFGQSVHSAAESEMMTSCKAFKCGRHRSSNTRHGGKRGFVLEIKTGPREVIGLGGLGGKRDPWR